jgi:hypothetical protein
MKGNMIRRNKKRILYCLLAAFFVLTGSFIFVYHANAGQGGGSGDGSCANGCHSGVPVAKIQVGNWGSWREVNFGGARVASWSGDRLDALMDSTFNRAVADCKAKAQARGKTCNNPRLVTIGYIVNGGNTWVTSHSTVKLNGTDPGCQSINVNNHNITTCTPDLSGISGTIRSEYNNVKNNQVVAMVVVGESQFPQKGWRENWTNIPESDVKSVSTINSEDLTACPVYYSIQANGYDGYVRNMSAQSKLVLTPYGQLWNAINQGKNTWTDPANGNVLSWFQVEKQPQGDYKTNPTAAVNRAVADIKLAHDVACAETYKMKIDYNLDTDGGIPGQQLNKQFARGGQYKLVKQTKNAVITVKNLNLDYYRRDVNWGQWNGWSECYQGESGCGHIGESRPADPSGLVTDLYGTGQRGRYSVGDWVKGDSNEIQNAVNKGGNVNVAGRRLSAIFASDNSMIGHNTNNGVSWNTGGKDKWIFGSSTGIIDGTKFHGVANELQSYVAVAMQDFININCNQDDFDTIVNYVRGRKDANGKSILDESSVKSTKYNGSLSTVVMTGFPAVQKINQRALDIVASANDGSYPGWSGNKGDTNGWSSSDSEKAGDADPIYTKECPFDCSDSTSASTSTSTNVGDKSTSSGSVSSADKATGSFGILSSKLNASTSTLLSGLQGNDKINQPVANTADPVFFRDNEWNYMNLDQWAPVSAASVNYNKSTTPVTTTFVVNTDGSPWYIGDNKTPVTKVQALDPKTNTWVDILNGTQEGSSSQWSSSENSKSQTVTQNFVNSDMRTATTQLATNVTKIRIKSPWASEKNSPLKFNVKWEYTAQNSAPVVSTWSTQGDGSVSGNSTTKDMGTSTSKVDGKCDSQYHLPGVSYNDHSSFIQPETGQSVKNNLDKSYQGEGQTMSGWFTVTFVRATSE